jgi:hypothetical protein
VEAQEDRIRSIRHHNAGFPWPVQQGIVAQSKTSVPKPQSTLALGEDAVKDLVLLMEPDKNGKNLQASMDEIYGRGV